MAAGSNAEQIAADRALPSEIEASAVRQVDGHLRAQAKAERDIARNLKDRNCRDLAAAHDRMAELYDAAAHHTRMGGSGA